MEEEFQPPPRPEFNDQIVASNNRSMELFSQIETMSSNLSANLSTAISMLSQPQPQPFFRASPYFQIDTVPKCTLPPLRQGSFNFG